MNSAPGIFAARSLPHDTGTSRSLEPWTTRVGTDIRAHKPPSGPGQDRHRWPEAGFHTKHEVLPGALFQCLCDAILVCCQDAPLLHLFPFPQHVQRKLDAWRPVVPGRFRSLSVEDLELLFDDPGYRIFVRPEIRGGPSQYEGPGSFREDGCETGSQWVPPRTSRSHAFYPLRGGPATRPGLLPGAQGHTPTPYGQTASSPGDRTR